MIQSGIACYLVGMGVGLMLIPIASPGSPGNYMLFATCTMIHLFTSFKALSAIAFNSLNRQRLSLLTDEYYAKIVDIGQHSMEDILSATEKYADGIIY
jgi:hypothetical protein